MVLTAKSGRALIARPNFDKGGEMTEKANDKLPEQPRRLKRIRVCGKWQKPGYRPSEAEVTAWKLRCRDRDLNEKTGKPKKDQTAPKK